MDVFIDVSKKDYLTTTKQLLKPHTEANPEVSVTSIINVAIKVLAEESHVAEKLQHRPCLGWLI